MLCLPTGLTGLKKFGENADYSQELLSNSVIRSDRSRRFTMQRSYQKYKRRIHIRIGLANPYRLATLPCRLSSYSAAQSFQSLTDTLAPTNRAYSVTKWWKW